MLLGRHTGSDESSVVYRAGYLQVLLAIVLVLAATGQTGEAYGQEGSLVARFESAWTFLREEGLQGTKGYLLRERDSVYTLSIPLSSTASRPRQGNSLRHGTVQFKGRNVAVGDAECAHVARPNGPVTEAPCVPLFNPVPGMPKWYPTRITNRSVRFNYGSVHYNAWVTIALVDMYEATQDTKYLRRAQRIIQSMLQHVNMEAGTFPRFRVDDEVPTYVAMIQSWLMQAINRYCGIETAYCTPAIEAVQRSLSHGYRHMSRGVWNHWTSSRIGEVIAYNTVGRPIDREAVATEFEMMRDHMRTYGFIPYLKNGEHPNFPMHRPTYFTYDLRLLAKLAHLSSFVDAFEVHVTPMFERAFNVNYGQYFANNSYSVLYAHLAFGYTDDAFVHGQQDAAFLSRAPETPGEAVEQMQAIAAILRYLKERS